MKFARDILLLDMATSGPVPEKDFPLQLSSVLLDKDNLLEKGSFNTFIRHPFSQTTNDRIVQTLGIPKEKWMAAPNLKSVLNQFRDQFSYNVTLASQNIANVNFLRESFRRANLPYEYDYHIIELWTIEYLFLSRLNMKKIPTAETIGTYLKLKKDRENDALANCRYLADIFRKLVNIG